MIDLDSIFTAAEKRALATLVKRGFEAFAEARLDDVRELETGRRRRTFRNSGRYDLVLALRHAAPKAEDPGPDPEVEAGKPDPTEDPAPEAGDPADG